MCYDTFLRYKCRKFLPSTVLCNRSLTKELLNAKPSVTDLKIVKNAIMIKHNKILLHVRTN